MKINICGIQYKVSECTDHFDCDCHLGMVDYKTGEIILNKDMSHDVRESVLYHEILHAILVHIGRDDLSEDEVLVTSLSNEIFQMFRLRGDRYNWNE